jgi:hypothetical protein
MASEKNNLNPTQILWFQPNIQAAIQQKMSYAAYGVYTLLVNLTSATNGQTSFENIFDFLKKNFGKADFSEELILLSEIESVGEVEISDQIIRVLAFFDNRIVPDFDDFE